MLRFWVIREINSRFCSKTQWQMFLLVSGRQVGAQVDGHQHGVSIQISINFGKTFLRISSMIKIAVTWILARVFAYVPSFYFQILDLIYWTVLIFYIDLFWMAWHWKPAIVVVTPPVSVSFSFTFVATYATAHGCRMIRSVDDRMGADGGWIACGCGMIDSDSDVVDGLVVNVISGSSNGGMWTVDKNLRSVRTVTMVRIIVTCTDKSKRNTLTSRSG